MARKPTKDERSQSSFMRGYKEASSGKPKSNPFDNPSLFYENYEKGYEAGKPSKGFV